MKEIKKYAVLRVWASLNEDVVFTTNIEQDARDFARIKKNEEGKTFVVAELNVIATEEPSNE